MRLVLFSHACIWCWHTICIHVAIGVTRVLVIEAHPDSTIEDLRLDRPFAGLKTFCDSIDLNSLTKKVRGYVCAALQ